MAWNGNSLYLLNACFRSHCELIHAYIYFFFAVPRAGPRNMRVFETTTSTISIGWDHAEGPVQQYKIAYAPLTGDPITEFVSKSIYLVIHSFNTIYLRILSICTTFRSATWSDINKKMYCTWFISAHYSGFLCRLLFPATEIMLSFKICFLTPRTTSQSRQFILRDLADL